MSLPLIRAEDAAEKIGSGAVFIDIRQDGEYRREHIEGALLQPLNLLQQQGLPDEVLSAECLIFHCKSGMRTQMAAKTLAEAAGGCEAYILQNGLHGWKAAGQTTITAPAQPLDIMRQVQITAGLLILSGTVLGHLLHPDFYLLCAFVGSSLLFAGLTGFCGMAKLLAAMPWNRPRPPSIQ